MFGVVFLTLFLGSDLLFAINRDCPDYFIANPQYTGGSSQDECYPESFVYYTSVRQGFYLFLEAVINDYQISPDDWVGAFNGNVCVGARQWGSCGGTNACDVPVLGDDSSDFCNGYLNEGDIPSFKIYDVSENVYIDATSSDYIPWSSGMTEVVDILYSYSSIDGCTDQSACNYDPYSSEDDGSCDYTCNFDLWDTDNNGVLDNYNDFEFTGSMTLMVALDGNSSFGDNGDMVAAFVGNEQRGVAQADLIPFGQHSGTYQFQMMIYSNISEGETLEFYYYDQSDNTVYNLGETYIFSNNMIVGDVINPFIFNLESDWLSGNVAVPSSFSIKNIYPNPFNPVVNIEFEIRESSDIKFTFYNIIGKNVGEYDYGYTQAGVYSFTWNPNLSSGTYFISMVDNKNNLSSRKVTLIK
tara:strand:- start:492 stop:1727 length:1236 start_codon:yes stop_codon:yes gene_type:complete